MSLANDYSKTSKTSDDCLAVDGCGILSAWVAARVVSPMRATAPACVVLFPSRSPRATRRLTHPKETACRRGRRVDASSNSCWHFKSSSSDAYVQTETVDVQTVSKGLMPFLSVDHHAHSMHTLTQCGFLDVSCDWVYRFMDLVMTRADNRHVRLRSRTV